MTTCAPTPTTSPWRRYAPLALIGAALGAFFALRLDRYVTLDSLVASRAALQGAIDQHGPVALAAFVLVYAALVAISAPGATVLTLAGGALFGVWFGAAGSVLGATLGACALFLAARSALGGALASRLGPKAARLREGFQSGAVGYMLFLRLSPVFPFWFVNLAAAFAGVRFTTFLWTTAVGILPAGLVFASAGASLDRIAAAALAARQTCLANGKADCGLHIPLSAIVTPQIFALLLGLSLLALAPVAAKRLRAGSKGEPPA